MPTDNKTIMQSIVAFFVLMLLILYLMRPSLTSFSNYFPSLSAEMNQSSHFIKPFKNRNAIAPYLEELKMEIGAELGVQSGTFSAHMLTKWPNCKKYYLVDTWTVSKNYKDFANVKNETQNQLFETAKKKLQKFADKTEFIRARTDVAVKQFADNYLDFVYVDARHDYCACKKDLEMWWQKIRKGGILAGHDYLSHEDVEPSQNWRLCEDGRIELGSVKRAVNEFAMSRDIGVTVAYREGGANSYMMRKPYS